MNSKVPKDEVLPFFAWCGPFLGFESEDAIFLTY